MNALLDLSVTTPARPVSVPRRTGIRSVVAGVVLADSLALVAAGMTALALTFGPGNLRPQNVQTLTGHVAVDFFGLVPIWIICLALCRAYAPRDLGYRGEEIKALLRGCWVAATAAAAGSYLINYDVSRRFYLWSFTIGTVLLLVVRLGAASWIGRMRATGSLRSRVVAVGTPAAVAELRQIVQRRPDLGYQITAVCPRDGDPVSVARAVGATTVMVASDAYTTSHALRRVSWDAGDSGIDLVMVPGLLDVASPRIHTRPVGGLPLMHILPPRVDHALRWQKSLFDRVCAFVLLVVLSPLLLAVAVAVKVDGPGPVLYRQRRVGVDGAVFNLWKFRSMVNDAAAHHDELRGTLPALLFKLHQDPRVTRVGRQLRRYSLDELPQLVNVLRGEMSLVGPRPQVPAEVAEYDDDTFRRLRVRPGMTGLWQVSGRSTLSVEESVRLDLMYVDNWSMAGDVVILARTIAAVVRHDGAC